MSMSFALSKKRIGSNANSSSVLTSPFSNDVAFDPPTDDNELFVSRELRGTQVRRSGVKWATQELVQIHKQLKDPSGRD